MEVFFVFVTQKPGWPDPEVKVNCLFSDVIWATAPSTASVTNVTQIYSFCSPKTLLYLSF